MINGVKYCPNETEPDKKWKYGDKCFKSCKDTAENTFPVSWDDDHDQRMCEIDTPSNRRRYYLTRFGPSAAYKALRIGKDAITTAPSYLKSAAECVGEACKNLFNSSPLELPYPYDGEPGWFDHPDPTTGIDYYHPRDVAPRTKKTQAVADNQVDDHQGSWVDWFDPIKYPDQPPNKKNNFLLYIFIVY